MAMDIERKEQRDSPRDGGEVRWRGRWMWKEAGSERAGQAFYVYVTRGW